MQDNYNLNFIKMFRPTLKQGCVLHGINQLLLMTLMIRRQSFKSVYLISCLFFFAIHHLANGVISLPRKMLNCLNFYILFSYLTVAASRL